MMVIASRRSSTAKKAGTFASSGKAGSEGGLLANKIDDEKHLKSKSSQLRLLWRLFVAFILAVTVLMITVPDELKRMFMKERQHSLSSTPTSSNANIIINSSSFITTKEEEEKSLKDAAKAKYENCTISFVPPPPRPESEWRKPLWVTSYPASGSASPSKRGDLTKQLIDAITGLQQATKNYHMSIRGGKLKRCHGVSETAACTQGHPFVSVGPDMQTQNFQSAMIFSLRNFATAFPAGHTDKHIAYHDGQGQPPEEQWRKVRDEYMESSINTWRSMIQWWKQAKYYHIALYLPLEWLLSPTKGPTLVQQLADAYQSAGFEVAPPSDIPCIWYQMARQEWKRQQYLLQDYLPGYTRKQRDYIVQQYDQALMQEANDDPILTTILQEYKHQVLTNTKLDRPALQN